MCLHIDLKYDRTGTTIETDSMGISYEDEIKIYKCIICKKEFKVKW